jgi:hypothetical protein
MNGANGGKPTTTFPPHAYEGVVGRNSVPAVSAVQWPGTVGVATEMQPRHGHELTFTRLVSGETPDLDPSIHNEGNPK